MKKSHLNIEVPLSKTDNGMLKFLHQESTNPVSTMQLPQGDKLRMMAEIIKSIYFLIDACYKHFKKRKVNQSRAVRDNFSKALTGEFPNQGIDFSKVIILNGSLAPPCATMTQAEGSNKLSFSWAACTQKNSNQTDELIGMIYCPETAEFWCEQNLGIKRADEFCTIDIPEVFQELLVHVWLAYRSAEQRSYSDSSYMGKVLTNKADNHENL